MNVADDVLEDGGPRASPGAPREARVEGAADVRAHDKPSR